ncbi:isoform 4 of serine/threonine-protein phosphatase 6 regulatory ankyrin repeat subunit a [Fagus crenata]
MIEQKEDTEPVDLSNAILTAAKNGITEMVETAFQSYPMALYDVDQDRKNIVLLTVEHKQPHVYELLLDLKKKDLIKDTVFCEVDHNGDSALHLAAKKANFNWPGPGAASQMQWEIKWYEYIKNSPMGKRLLFVRNKNGQTPDEVFTESHADLVKQGEEWLIKTSQACSVVAGLFVTVAFSTDHVPFNSHIRVQRKRFPPRLTMEAFAGFISILPVYSNYLDIFHNSTFLHLQGSTDIYIFLVICNDLPAVNILCYVSVSALLSFGVGYLYECATT